MGSVEAVVYDHVRTSPGACALPLHVGPSPDNKNNYMKALHILLAL